MGDRSAGGTTLNAYAEFAEESLFNEKLVWFGARIAPFFLKIAISIGFRKIRPKPEPPLSRSL
jgi:hypothetical protein